MNRHRSTPAPAQLAYLAARLIAEDGVPDFAAARRKLARQYGLRHAKALPDDRAIAAALRSFQALYQADTQPVVLQAQLALAVEAMELLEDYSPWLVGEILHGTTGAGAVVRLELHTDAEKALQLFLLGRGIPFSLRERHVQQGAARLRVVVMDLSLTLGDVEVALLSSPALRFAPTSIDGTQPRRAKLPAVRALLDQASRSQLAASSAK